MNRVLLDAAERDGETIYVLYYLPDSYQPWAVWTARKDAPENTFWGHYFDTEEEARDYLDRKSFEFSGGRFNLVRMMDKMHVPYNERNEVYGKFDRWE